MAPRARTLPYPALTYTAAGYSRSPRTATWTWTSTWTRTATRARAGCATSPPRPRSTGTRGASWPATAGARPRRPARAAHANPALQILATTSRLRSKTSGGGCAWLHSKASLCSALQVLAPLSSVRGWVPEAVLRHACASQPCTSLLGSWSPTVLDLAGLAVCSGQHAARCMRPLCPCIANSRGGGSLILSPVLNCL